MALNVMNSKYDHIVTIVRRMKMPRVVRGVSVAAEVPGDAAAGSGMAGGGSAGGSVLQRGEKALRTGSDGLAGRRGAVNEAAPMARSGSMLRHRRPLRRSGLVVL